MGESMDSCMASMVKGGTRRSSYKNDAYCAHRCCKSLVLGRIGQGMREWLLFPPGEEDLLRDCTGNLPLDVTSSELSDCSRYPSAERSKGPIRVLQGPGEVIFIPSGWYHQVKNMEDTISINHNWTNAFGLQYTWRHLKSELVLVQKEIADCRKMEAWEQQCQVILKASAGMNFHELFQSLCLLALPRMKELAEMVSKAASNTSEDIAAGGLCVESLGLHKLQECLTRGLSCADYDFFGLRKKSKEKEECTSLLWPLLYREWLDIELVARDNAATIMAGCLHTNSSCTLSGLLSALPDKTVEHLMSSERHRFTNKQSLLVTFRVYELFCIQTVMTELLHSKEFAAVSPIF